jgi:CheY-like chemotaxis protein
MTTAQDQVRRLRHDLRTPLNHVLGYGELVLEEAEEGGVETLAMPLQALLRAGTEAVALIERYLTPAKTTPHEALEPLATAMTAPLAAIEERLGEIRALMGASPAGDVDKIEAALRYLRGQLSGNDQGAAEHEPASPAVSDGDGNLSKSEASVASEPADAGGGAILVVDDNAGNREMLGRRLERLGYRVGYAENGQQALDYLAAEAVDLVLLDIMMPVMDGYEALRRLKADARLRELPVIVISALDELASVVRCIEMGAEDYLTKPFDPVLLQARIGACLEKKRLRDQEVEYLAQVARVTAAAAAVETGTFGGEELNGVAARSDALGQLARVFQTMAREVRAREERLRRQVQELTIQIDRTREAHQVAEITETDYFKELQERARSLRGRGAGVVSGKDAG